ncbi:MAG: CinA family protein [Candidatus Omnitrophota bacterium]|nr:CinA family protein [Candidatus Omnitrophota bacterium]
MKIEANVGKVLRKLEMTIAVAESCTGGLISSRLTDISGSSDYFLMGIVAYSNKIKENILGVSPALLQKYGAVSKEAALEMAKGVRLLANTDIGIGVTGIAGPSGGTKSKPVGLVYIALIANKKEIVKEFRFKGSRIEVKSQATQAALKLIISVIASDRRERSNLF